MSETTPAQLAKLVRDRAGDVCEYCRLPQISQEAVFHINHIWPRVAYGSTSADNLALACVTCSLKKAARTHAHDPLTKELVPLFHPRQNRWTDHFLLVPRLPDTRSHTDRSSNRPGFGNESLRRHRHSQSLDETRMARRGITGNDRESAGEERSNVLKRLPTPLPTSPQFDRRQLDALWQERLADPVTVQKVRERIQ